jgi:hypothetical protein
MLAFDLNIHPVQVLIRCGRFPLTALISKIHSL